MSTGLLFPGQGSQFVGMGKDLADAYPEARAVFEAADETLGESLSELMWTGPEAELTQTRNAQPALLAHSVAVLRVLGDVAGAATVAAGHSLGEFSAYVAAGALGFEDALRAVRVRGEAMAATGSQRPGTMAAVLGLDAQVVEEVCGHVSREEGAGVVVPANFNATTQVVISGDVRAVERASETLAERGARRVVPLNVSGAFHSPLMANARPELEEALGRIDFSAPAFPVVSNVTGQAVTDGASIRDLLVEQLTSPVRWTESVATMMDAGVARFLEVGPGAVLSGLVRRAARRFPTVTLGTPDEVRAFLEEAENE